MAPVLRFFILGLVLAYTLAPIVVILLVSVSPGLFQVITNQAPTFRWYQEALANPTAQTAFLTSAGIALVVAIISVALGFASVRFVQRLNPIISIACIILISVPALVPALVSGFSLHVYYQFIGLDGTLLGIVATHVIYASPIAFFLLFVAHRNLNPEIEECARNLGASEHQIAFHVVLPQLAKVCVGAGIICGLISWDEFIITWFVSGFHKTLPTLIYGMLGNTLDQSLFALGTLITLVSLTLLVVTAFIMRKQLTISLARR
jgi:ABC-type spermidine/putrescine transport system permease subunit II